MTVIHETAYPRIKSNPSIRELEEIYTPSIKELRFVKKYARQPIPKLGLMIMLKMFQRLGYFIFIKDVPEPIILHISDHLEFGNAKKLNPLR